MKYYPSVILFIGGKLDPNRVSQFLVYRSVSGRTIRGMPYINFGYNKTALTLCGSACACQEHANKAVNTSHEASRKRKREDAQCRRRYRNTGLQTYRATHVKSGERWAVSRQRDGRGPSCQSQEGVSHPNVPHNSYIKSATFLESTSEPFSPPISQTPQQDSHPELNAHLFLVRIKAIMACNINAFYCLVELENKFVFANSRRDISEKSPPRETDP